MHPPFFAQLQFISAARMTVRIQYTSFDDREDGWHKWDGFDPFEQIYIPNFCNASRIFLRSNSIWQGRPNMLMSYVCTLVGTLSPIIHDFPYVIKSTVRESQVIYNINKRQPSGVGIFHLSQIPTYLCIHDGMRDKHRKSQPQDYAQQWSQSVLTLTPLANYP